jgi:type I restriction enzyme S subunit
MSVKELPTIRWPEDWRNVPLWAMFDRVKDVGHPDEEMLSVYREYGVIKKSSRDDNTNQTAEDRNIYQLIDHGWLVVNRMKAWQGSVGISPLRGIVSGHYICFRPRHGENPRFLDWLLRSDVYTIEYARMSRGVRPSQIEIDNDELHGLRIALPLFEEQRRIADFLDRETARIDALVAAKQQMMELLEERWQTVVREVALHSGWPLVPLRRLWTVTDCKHTTPSYVPDGFPVVSPGDVTPGQLDLRSCHRFVNEADFNDLTEGGRRPRRGDIVYSRNASIGIAAYVNTDEPFTMGQDVCLIRSRTEYQPWLTYMLNSVGMDQLAEMKIGSTFDRVNISQLLDLQIPTPPYDWQITQTYRLDSENQRVNSLRLTLQEQIALLQEHRLALINSAVTGQLNISEAA